MKQIPLQNGKFTLVDDEDYEALSKFKWFCGTKYAYRSQWDRVKRKNKNFFMHREIMQTPKGFHTDHINCDKLDNRRSNLRICSVSENLHNTRTPHTNTTGYKGTSWCKIKKKFRARIRIDKKLIALGCFDSVIDAHEAYCVAVREKFGKFGRTA
jgi:HNH endonuclease